MGLFDWLFGGKRLPQIQSRVWMSEDALWRKFSAEVHDELTQGRHVLLVCHFPDTWEHTLKWLEGSAIAFEDIQPRTLRELQALLQGRQPQLWLMAAHEIPPIDDENVAENSPPIRMTVMATEHHPHLAGDQKLQKLAQALKAEGGIIVESALDQVQFKSYSSHVVTLLKALGMDDTEHVETPVVARQIAHIQRRIAEKVPDCPSAESAKDWMDRYAGE
ncbi:MAG: hypothetical protein KDA88_06040 [Planctomycetaceae bacterium]|nr:hypothetical protein [Planctomycetaceae bacterium]MCB9950586.1 hypothetical protein [Planctomycetaceae bacterium]